MANYTKVFADTYPNGWQAKPDTSTPYTTDVKNNEDATFRAIEDYLYNNPIGDITSASIKDLADVSSTSPTAGQTLVWDDTEEKYIPGSPASSISDLTDVDFTTPPTNGQTIIYDSTSSKFKPGNIATKLMNLSDVINYSWFEPGQVPVYGSNSDNGYFYLQKLSIGQLGGVDPNVEYANKKSGDALVYEEGTGGSAGYFKLKQVISPTVDSTLLYNSNLVLIGDGDGSKINYRADEVLCVNRVMGFHTNGNGFGSYDGSSDYDKIIWDNRFIVYNPVIGTVTDIPDYYAHVYDDTDMQNIIIDAVFNVIKTTTDSSGVETRRVYVIPLGGSRAAGDCFSINLKSVTVHDENDPSTDTFTIGLEYFINGFTDITTVGQDDTVYTELDIRFGYMILPQQDNEGE